MVPRNVCVCNCGVRRSLARGGRTGAAGGVDDATADAHTEHTGFDARTEPGDYSKGPRDGAFCVRLESGRYLLC